MSRLPHFLDNLLIDGSEVCQPYVLAGHHLPPGRFPVLISVKRLSRPQGHSVAGRIRSIEKSNDLIRVEPTTFWLIMYCLNELRCRVPPSVTVKRMMFLVVKLSSLEKP
jgi:hypothetical protein